MMKRILPILLAVLLLTAVLAVPANAAENADVAKGTQVATDAAKMTFPTDGAEHTATCPVCGVSATWTPLTPAMLSAGFTAAEANTHYYLTDSVEAAGAKFTMYNSSTYTSCLHLNGKNITNTSGVAIEGAAGKLNIMGSGIVKGAGAADDYSSAATVVMGNKGSVNLYGGTYEKYDTAAATNTVGIGWGGGTVAVYGATITGGTAGRAVYIDGTNGVTSAVLNIYGGTIHNGGNSNVYVEKNATLNMYGGIITGGKAASGGNIYVDGGVFNLHDGIVTAGVATSNGGNVYVTNSGAMNMYGGTVSGTRDAEGNATGGKAQNGGNIAIHTSCVLNITGGIVENGTAEREGGNIFAKPAYTTKLAEYPKVDLENVIIRNGKTTASSNSYGGGNLAFTRVTATIGKGTQILNGETASRGGNLRMFVGTLVMTGGEISGGIANRGTGYEEIHLEASEAKYPARMYMLGGVIENRETESEAIRVNAYSEFYLGGDATIVDNNPANPDLHIYKASAGTGKLFICDGWTGSATVSSNAGTWTVGGVAPTAQFQVVTLDENRNATVGGSFTGKLKNIAAGAQLACTGDANGALTIGGLAVVDAAGNVTMTTDPLGLWATGDYAYIRLYNAYEITDPADGLWIDVNGCALTLSGSGTVNAFDTANDSYRAGACGQITNNGTVTVNSDVVAPNGKRYLALTDDTTTMHAVSLRLTVVSLRTSSAGIYYKAKYECDEALAAKIKRYGVVVSTVDMPGTDFLVEWDDNKYTIAGSGTDFVSGKEVTSAIVNNIMKDSLDATVNATRGEMKVYANPYICFDMGKDLIIVEDNENAGKMAGEAGFDGTALSLHDAMDLLDSAYMDYDATTRKLIDSFYEKWQQKGMADWTFVNIGSQASRVDNSPLEFAAGSTEAECPVCKTMVTWIPFGQSADTTTNIGTPANGAHYYLTEDITYTGSSAGFIAAGEKNETACLHLNGHDLTATAHAAVYSPYATAGVINVMGEGTVSGNRSGTGTTIYLSSKDAAGTINLYGGTYVQPASNTSSMTALVNGGSIHVYDDAWLKGNGSNNAAYVDKAGNAATTFAVHGGKITDGELATADGAATKSRTVIVDGRSYVEQITIRNKDTAVQIAGAPVIDYICMDTGVKLTVGNLVKGAKITVSAVNGAFTHAFEKAEAYKDYFYAWNEPDAIGVTEAGELSYDVNYEHYMTPYTGDVTNGGQGDGEIHYYFMAAAGMIMDPDNGGDKDKWGDSCLVVFPDGKTMLIDSGYEVQAPVIIGNLQRMGVTTLDYLLITHAHSDHAGGAFGETSTFLNDIKVNQVYYQGMSDTTWDSRLETKCTEKNIPYEVIDMGDVLTFGENEKQVTLTMLWPGEDIDKTIDAWQNKHSMVFRFDYGEHSSLFTADIYDYTDAKLLELYTSGELDADLMKVPHHGLGTNTSSVALLAAVTPDYAVATGSFDIPSTITTRYTNVGATLLEDRFHGYIHISSGTDGEMTVEHEGQ